MTPDRRTEIRQRIDAGETLDANELLHAALTRWEQTAETEGEASVAASLRHVEAFALAAIACELRELRLRPPRLQVAGDVNTYPGPTA